MTGESEKDLDKLVKKRFVSLEKCCSQKNAIAVFNRVFFSKKSAGIIDFHRIAMLP